MARESKFTPEVATAICTLVAAGIPMEVAANKQGIHRSTLYDWRDRGRKGDPAYEDFAADLDKAQAEAEVAITQNVVSAAKHDWKAGAFWLKCRNRALYGDQLQLTAQVQQGIEKLVDDLRPHMSAPAFSELLHAIAAVMGIEGVATQAAGDDAGGEPASKH